LEASREKRDAYQEVIKDISPERIVYIEEIVIDMSICKYRNWGRTNEKLLGKKSGKYYERTNIIAVLLNNKSIAPTVFNGTCNTDFFNQRSKARPSCYLWTMPHSINQRID
jgi:hypothetical protein